MRGITVRPHGATPFERGETLTSLYTMGSVIALFALRFSDDEPDRPVIVHTGRTGRS